MGHVVVILEAAATFVAILCITTYILLVVTGRRWPFNLCNALGWPVFVVAIQHGAYQAAALNLFFILVGTIGLVVDIVRWTEGISA